MQPDYSLDALSLFFDYAAEKGLMKRQTAMGRKGAALKVLESLDAAEIQDLRNVDIDDASRRFSNTRGRSYKPESLRVYTSRTKSAVSEFVRYVDNPVSFKPSIPQRRRPKKVAPDSSQETATRPVTRADETAQPRDHGTQSHHARNDVHVLAVPIPIRDGVMVQLQGIPADLTASEAEKIANVVKAYANGDG